MRLQLLRKRKNTKTEREEIKADKESSKKLSKTEKNYLSLRKNFNASIRFPELVKDFTYNLVSLFQPYTIVFIHLKKRSH